MSGFLKTGSAFPHFQFMCIFGDTQKSCSQNAIVIDSKRSILSTFVSPRKMGSICVKWWTELANGNQMWQTETHTLIRCWNYVDVIEWQFNWRAFLFFIKCLVKLAGPWWSNQLVSLEKGKYIFTPLGWETGHLIFELIFKYKIRVFFLKWGLTINATFNEFLS